MYRNGSSTVWYKSSLGDILGLHIGAEVVSFPRAGYSTLQDETIRLSGNVGDRSLCDTAPYPEVDPEASSLTNNI